MAANLLIHGDYNVLVVDWGAGSALPYTKAVANTRLVGLEIAHLANTLIVRRRVVQDRRFFLSGDPGTSCHYVTEY